MADERDNLLYRAKLAEQTERYEDMVEIMKQISKFGVTLKCEERNLLSVAYKNVVGAKRSAWRFTMSAEQKAYAQSEERGARAREYRNVIAKEVESVCKDLLKLVDDYLLPKDEEEKSVEKEEKSETTVKDENTVFYLKMKGDYYRYIAEVVVDEAREDAVKKSKLAYEEAQVKASSLASTNQVRLGLALNFSVFYYEIMNEQDEACKLAKNAFDEAIQQVDTLNEASYKDTTLIMQLLRDNLMLWTADPEPEEDPKPKEAEEEGEGEKDA